MCTPWFVLRAVNIIAKNMVLLRVFAHRFFVITAFLVVGFAKTIFAT
ncbi:MAG: hypothetical protein NZ899_11240 [Thermoguttaceae bacterium]|nr:hypothetical protein [Thermoguttaceae bacterium]MDW8077766.1 hypothetical protein [Thermoguttaceae bacterium]